MKIIQPIVKINSAELNQNKVIRLSYYARVCYQSEADSSEADAFLTKLIKNGHESVIEHEKVTVTFIVDRGVSNQIIRHRIGSYCQESTRYCNYSLNRFGGEITVIEPFFFNEKEKEYQLWKDLCQDAEMTYLKLLNTVTPEEARAVLPNSLKTELVTTYNFREWRHFFSLRCAKEAHPQIRQISIPLLLFFKKCFSPIFDDIKFDENFSDENYAKIIVEYSEK